MKASTLGFYINAASLTLPVRGLGLLAPFKGEETSKGEIIGFDISKPHLHLDFSIFPLTPHKGVPQLLQALKTENNKTNKHTMCYLPFGVFQGIFFLWHYYLLHKYFQINLLNPLSFCFPHWIMKKTQPTPSLWRHSTVVGGPDSIQGSVSVFVTGTDIPQIRSFKESMWSERLSLGFWERQRVQRARLVKFHRIVKRTLISTYLLMLASGPDWSMGPKEQNPSCIFTCRKLPLHFLLL